MTKITRRTATFAILSAPLAIASTAQAGTTHKVSISGMAYHPAELTIRAGDSVEWKNEDDMAHTATDKGRGWDTRTLAANRSATITFDTPGQFDYFCTIHTNMKGRIIVE